MVRVVTKVYKIAPCCTFARHSARVLTLTIYHTLVTKAAFNNTYYIISELQTSSKRRYPCKSDHVGPVTNRTACICCLYLSTMMTSLPSSTLAVLSRLLSLHFRSWLPIIRVLLPITNTSLILRYSLYQRWAGKMLKCTVCTRGAMRCAIG